jgi:multicomponent Na+:H+ antiporter subunit G
MISSILLIIGLAFNLLGCIGILRLPDLYNRLQAATKCVTLGTCCLLLSLVAHYGLNDFGIKALIAIPFLFFTSTIAAHALVRGSYISGIKMWDKSVVDEYAKEKKLPLEGNTNDHNK